MTEGEDVRLSAIVSGEPHPYVHWEKDNQTVLPGLGVERKTEEHTHSLILPSSTIDDCGSYKVTAKNFLGEDSSSILVDVQGCFLVLKRMIHKSFTKNQSF